MSEHLNNYSPEEQNESHESSFDNDVFDISTLISPDQHADIKRQVEVSHAERTQQKATHVEAATSDVYDLFNTEQMPESEREQQGQTVFVDGKQFVVAEAYRDKSSNNDGQGNEWVVYKNEQGQEVHTMHFNREDPSIETEKAKTEKVADDPIDTLAAIEASIAKHSARSIETRETQSYPERSLNFVRAMERQGISFSYEEISSESDASSGFEGIYTLNHERTSNEPTVRLYRGVRSMDASILEQSSYAEKGIKGLNLSPGNQEKIIDDIRQFTDNPTYENLAQYAESLRMYSKRTGDKDNLDSRMRGVENSILQGMSLEGALKFEHVHSAAGAGMLDISPYIASSDRPELAAAYGNAMLVLDVPVSMIAGYGEDGEVLITGRLSPEDVTAVAIKAENTENMYDDYSKAHANTVAEMVSMKNGSTKYEDAKQHIDQRTANREASMMESNRRAVDKARAEGLRLLTQDSILQEAGMEWNPDLSYKEQKAYLFNFLNSHLETPLEGELYPISDKGYSDYLAVGGEIKNPDALGQKYGIYSPDTATDSMISDLSNKFIKEDDRRYFREQKRKKRLAAQEQAQKG